ncbi:coronafacic acid synthetase [Nonomuraea lactucae]|uniref:coronafacic acid synthetase n=1 Tax=Nonomuraea lactucae TaxID=2249762 RepID=UPI0013B36EEE|nr:coronafacic acid synthetase [Nonomuraea lactucae]
MNFTGLATVARGEAYRPELTTVRGSIPNLYADPVAWLVADAVRDALTACPGDVAAARDDVGTILVSAHCTRHTMRAVAGSAAGGRVSPLRFAGASPGTAGSLACIVHGFRGPALTLSTGARDGLPTARVLARSWLRSGAAAYVIVSVHGVDAQGGHRVRSVVLAAEPESPVSR